MHVNGGFGPEAGCDIQLPKVTAEPPKKRLCSSAEALSMGVAANCGGASPTGTLRLSSCNGLLMSHSPLTSARPTVDRALVHESAGGARWDVDLHRPPTAYRDARIGEQFDGIIYPRYHAHPPDRERPKNHGRPRRASSLDTSPLAPACCRLRPGIIWSSGSRQVRLTLPASAFTPWCRGAETPALTRETRTGVPEVAPK